MNVRYITCSDPRPHNSFDDLMHLWNLDNRVEIAVQMHPGKVSPGTERYKWIAELVDKMRYEFPRRNLAIHVNQDWCREICRGNIPDELKPFFDANWVYSFHCLPVVQRIQLNMSQKVADSLNARVLKDLISAFPDQEFIIQYNDKTKEAVERLHKTGAKFSLLFDASGGNGIAPKSWESPIYNEHPMGYAGGISPENVRRNLRQIKRVAKDDEIWIDAEGKLKTDDKFDCERARRYITKAARWIQRQR